MDYREELPASLLKAQKSLEPYIKRRYEASKIRQLLSSHLGSQLNSFGHPLNRPLSLVDQACDVEAASHGVRGLQREYLRAVRANIKARNEYAAISKEHHARRPGEGIQSGSQDPRQSNACSELEAFVHLTMQQQKHERLRITQDYVDVLSQKPAAAAEHLDPKIALRDVDSLPKVPSEVLHNTSAVSTASGMDLKGLVDQLEKSVLRAKMLLKKEQKLLAKVRADNSSSSASRGDRLQALGLTRNALINWIEAEMEKAGDGLADAEDGEISNHDARGKDYIEAQLVSIQRQYGRYIEARQALVTSSSSISQPLASTTTEEDSVVPALTDDSPIFQGMQVIYPYLDSLVSTASEQKAAIQQRSHLTISLAKQIKEASQGMDRLADESHLLPAHPMPAASSQRKGLQGPLSFNDELLNHEKPDSSARGRAWVYAAESAGTATKDAIAEQVEEGNKAMDESRDSLSRLYHLLGYETQEDGLRVSNHKQDIWTVLDGTLGVIQGDGVAGR